MTILLLSLVIVLALHALMVQRQLAELQATLNALAEMLGEAIDTWRNQ
jgi:hypothetical protein